VPSLTVMARGMPYFGRASRGRSTSGAQIADAALRAGAGPRRSPADFRLRSEHRSVAATRSATTLYTNMFRNSVLRQGHGHLGGVERASKRGP
jgi:hypothetical protein